jgi:hypothetical protein
MTRITAAVLAVAITAVLFEAAVGGALWLVNHARFFAVLHAHAFLPIMIVFNTVFVPTFLIVLTRAKREDEKIERLTPLKRQPLKVPPAF